MADEMMRRIVVTGGASGIGRATVEAFLAQGEMVIALDRDEAGLHRLANQAGRSAALATIRCDLGDPQDIARAFVAVGPIDVAVNAAAVGQHAGPVETLDLATVDSVMNVNFRGVLLCMQQEIPLIRAQGRGGAIVNISSSGGIRGAAGMSVYCAAKHAVIGLTRSVAIEVAREKIRVNAVCPGFTDTAMLRGWTDGVDTVPGLAESLGRSTPIGRLADPQEVAEAILWLAGGASRYVIGSVISVDGGVTAV